MQPPAGQLQVQLGCDHRHMASITFATEGSVAVVTIERPEVRNAVDRPTAAELVEAFRRFDADPALDAAVLTGAGGNFCAGADLKGVAEGRGPGHDPHRPPGNSRGSGGDRPGESRRAPRRGAHSGSRARPGARAFAPGLPAQRPPLRL